MEPFLGEIRINGFDFTPPGWAFCEGQSMEVVQNQALFSLLGNTFGGDSNTTFNLPDFRGRCPLGAGVDPVSRIIINQGEYEGTEIATLTVGNLPRHTHNVIACMDEPDRSIVNNNTGVWAAAPIYGSPVNLVGLSTDASVIAGNGLPFNNMQPYQVVNFCIATVGLYPSRS